MAIWPKICKICMENTDSRDNPLISPCDCDGSMKYVHTECVNTWRNQNLDNINIDRCRDCNSFYTIEKQFDDETFEVDNTIINFISNNLNIILIACLIMFCSFLVFLTDPITTYFSLNIYVTSDINEFEYILKNNFIVALFYYYNFVSQLGFTSLFIYFVIKSFLNINRKLEYFNNIFFIYLYNVILLLHFWYMYYLLLFIAGKENKTVKKNVIKLYIFCSSSFCINYLYSFKNLYIFHNNIVEKLNSENKGKIVNKPEIINNNITDGIIEI